jgi:GNAT superfamily N-acetyltransferase
MISPKADREQGDPDDLLTVDAVGRDLIGHGIVIVAERRQDGALVGYATGHATYETGHAERGLYIGDLYVAPEHRRQGIARALLAAMARAGHATGARHLWLTAQEGNTPAHAFYRRLGSKGERVLAFAVVEQDFLNLAAEPPPYPQPARDADQVAALFNAINSLGGTPPPVAMTAAHVAHRSAEPWSLLRVAEAEASSPVSSPAARPMIRHAAGCMIVVDLMSARTAAGHRPRADGRPRRRRPTQRRQPLVGRGDDEAQAFYLPRRRVEDHFEGRILIGAAYDTRCEAET